MARASPRTVRWIGRLFSLGAFSALAVMLAHSDWQEFVQPLATAQPGWLVAALVVQLAVECAKTIRWQLLLGLPMTALPELLALVLSSRLLNALAPLRAGDVWRVAFVVRTQRRGLMIVGGSLVAEKLFDAIALGSLSLVLIGSAGRELPLPLLVAGAMIAGAGLILGARRPWLRLPQLERWVGELRPLCRLPILLGAATLTAAGLGLGLLVNLFVLRALGLPVSFVACSIVLLSGYAVGVLPGPPGQLGLFELAVAAPLTILGFSPATAFAAALTLHLVLLATLLLGGLLALPLGFFKQLRATRAVGAGSSSE